MSKMNFAATRIVVVTIGLALATGCAWTTASHGPAVPVGPTDVQRLAGNWSGWLESPRLSAPQLMTLVLRSDGMIEMSWGGGSPIRSWVIARDGILKFGDGWTTATLHEVGGRSVLYLNGRNPHSDSLFSAALRRTSP